MSFIFFFFFFQAEDGIRDLTVTGVQTCALPIWYPPCVHSVGCTEIVPRAAVTVSVRAGGAAGYTDPRRDVRAAAGELARRKWGAHAWSRWRFCRAAGRPQCSDGEQKRDDAIWGHGVAWGM